MILVEGVVRKYGEFTAVKDVSFSIEKGQIVGLLGHNGAGKTTLMKMLTGYLEPHAGSIRIAGMELESERIAIQQKIGYLPESSPLYPDMQVLEYLDYVCDLRALPPESRAAAIARVVEKTRLTEKAHAGIATLSRGFRQRLGVAQALLHAPEILILDEPTNGLDPSQIQDMRALIRELSADTTIILSTHILQEVQAVCDRVLVIQHGELAIDSSLEELQESSRIILTVDQAPNVVCPLVGGLGGVAAVEVLGSRSFGQTYGIALTSSDGGSSGTALAPQVAKLVVDEGWELFELVAERRSLEVIFANLSRRDVTAVVDTAAA